MPEYDVIIVGAGLAGLSAAIEITDSGLNALLIEADSRVGGRVQTDEVDGYLLDRGFQILLTAYPEAQRLLDFEPLDLMPFASGALVRIDDQFHPVGDPFRQPRDLLATARAPIGTWADKARIIEFRRRVRRQPAEQLFHQLDMTALERLQRFGFSPTIIERFFRPLVSGITLDPDLGGSRRQLEFVFRMLADGDAVVPAAGMGCIPEQLAMRIPANQFRFDTKVLEVGPHHVVTSEGERISATAVVVATDAMAAARFTGIDDPGWNSVTSVWFSAPEPPTDSTAIILDGSGAGPAVDVAVMSNVSARYAPPNRALIVASALATGDGIENAVQTQLRGWFGTSVDGWTMLRADRIDAAQPRFDIGRDPSLDSQLASGVYLAGDHRHDPSIHGALASGHRTGRAVVSQLTR